MSMLARQVPLEEAWTPSEHADVCCLIYATQNGWKLPILFEEMGVPYDWALVDFDKNEQRSERYRRLFHQRARDTDFEAIRVATRSGGGLGAVTGEDALPAEVASVREPNAPTYH